jgi:electron transfer flavoprotein beta subunit
LEIVVCVKPVPEAESRLRANAAGTGLDADGVKFVLAGYDESAVEQALLLKQEAAGSKVHAVALGPASRIDELLRASIALGCDSATAVDADVGPLDDPLTAARGLASAIGSLGTHDLLLFGKQAGDDEEGVVGGATAEALGIPFVGFVVDLHYDAASGRLRFHRSVERGEEAWTAPPPLAVGLQQAWNDPRTATLPAILRSRKTPIARRPSPPVDPSSPRSVPERFSLPPPRQGAKMIEYRSPQEAAQKLVQLLREEAKVFP